MSTLRAYLQLTKPSIMLLVLITGACGLVLEGQYLHGLHGALQFGLVLLALFLTGGSANALNQYFERDIDAQMHRTRQRRPLPLKQLSPRQALAFAVGIGAAGVTLLSWRFNVLSGALALGTILFYGLFYTLYLKPRTAQNIVIGGAAGAMAPVIAWAAATNGMAVAPWLLFLVVFLWTPPHFWALALYMQEDYKMVKMPMMPVVVGEAKTLRLMWYYSLLLVAVTLGLGLVGAGWLYLVAAAALGGWFLWRLWQLMQAPTRLLERGLFRYSIVYLLALFVILMAERLVGWSGHPGSGT